MKYCTRCVYPANHPLDIIFDEWGVCSGCRVHEEKDRLDWSEREKVLANILSAYKNKHHPYYDCIIPVLGNGDSYFVVDQIKHKFGFNPLLVSYNIHYNTKVGIRNLANLITKLDCDHMQLTVNPAVVKKITRASLSQFGDIYWHIAVGSQVYPIRVAVDLNIPLIIWPVNGWLDQVGKFSHLDAVEMSKKVWEEYNSRNYSPEKFISNDFELTRKEMLPYFYPSDEELSKAKIRGIYLGNFVRWDAQAQIEQMIRKYDYETMQQQRTFNYYESIFCHHNAGLQDYIKYLKYGFGKATEHVARDIRLKRLTREEGIQLVSQYDGEFPKKDLVNFLEWIEMDEQSLFATVDRFRDPKIWLKNQDETWVRQDHVANHANDKFVNEVKFSGVKKRAYIQTALKEPLAQDNEYVLMGRTYMDEHNFKAIEG